MTTVATPADEIVADADGWSHYVDWSGYFRKNMPHLHHQPCGSVWYATAEQAVKVKAEHECRP